VIKVFYKGDRLHPTFFTVCGLVVNLGAAGAFLYDRWRLAGVLILIAGFFDMVDGAVARRYGKVSRFGGFLDSVIDRYSDMGLLVALIIYYAVRQDLPLVVLSLLAAVGTILIPYARARAEIFLPRCNVGLMERAERILLLTVGSLFGVMPFILWILVIFTHLTVIYRIYYTWKEVEKLEEKELG
jgi:CDP-diacylglycerol--glycerol-3-phosphate 3-phosphatidyltransferase